MTLTTARRKAPFSSHKFVTTSVVSENHLTYAARRHPLDTPERCCDFWQNVVAKDSHHEPDKECVIVILLSTRLVPYAWHVVSIGKVNESLAHAREILRPCIAGAASAFVIMHNHPSGDPSPSQGDQCVTTRLIKASDIMQIDLLDHVIIGKPTSHTSGYFSFREAGLMS